MRSLRSSRRPRTVRPHTHRLSAGAALANTANAPEQDDGHAKPAACARPGLLLWCKKKTKGYAHVNVTNFNFSFQNGMAFCALIHKHRPDLIDFAALDPEDKARAPPRLRAPCPTPCAQSARRVGGQSSRTPRGSRRRET